MTDLEMTKLCAEAMGLDVERGAPSGTTSSDGGDPDFCYLKHWREHCGSRVYRPLENDAQAMALVKKLGLTVDPQEDKPPFTWRVVVADDGDWDKQIFAHGSDLNRAIVECAAAVQAAKVAA